MIDRNNQITSIHHFPSDRSLEDGQTAMRKTMLRRYRRVHQWLRKAKRVCFVCNRPDDPESLCTFLSDFSALYPGTVFDMINIRDREVETLSILRQNAGKGQLVEISFRDIHPDGAEIAVMAWKYSHVAVGAFSCPSVPEGNPPGQQSFAPSVGPSLSEQYIFYALRQTLLPEGFLWMK